MQRQGLLTYWRTTRSLGAFFGRKPITSQPVVVAEIVRFDVADKTPLSLPQGFNGLCACPKSAAHSICPKAVEPLAQGQGRGFVANVRCLRTLLAALLCCALAFFSAPSLAEESTENAPLAEHTVVLTGRRTSIELVERLSKQIEAPAKLKRVDGFDPEVLEVKALSPNRLRLSALAQGYTTVLLTDEKERQYVLEIYVKGDARHLQALISNRFPNSSVEASKIADSVVLSGWVSQPDHITQITEMADLLYPKVLNQMRVGGVQQVKLKCRILEVQRSKLRQMGFNFLGVTDNAFFSSTPGALTTVNNIALAPGSTSATFGSSAASMAFGAVSDAVTLQAFFDALRREELAKILAEPVLTTTNGHPAQMLSGGEFPVLVPQTLGTATIEWKKFGVSMEAVPIVLGEGRVRLEVMPEVSERDFANAITLSGTTVPGISTRRVNTQVELKFGQTLMLAGLLSWRQVASTQKTPFLGELPYAGALFRRVSYNDVETELVILVTPELVAPLDPGMVPPSGPGLGTTTPTDRELFGMGLLEVPNYGDPCTQCHGHGCPQCRHQAPIQRFSMPVQESHQSPQEFRTGTNQPAVPVLPPGKESALKSGFRSGAQQVGHTENRSNNAAPAIPSLTPRGTPNDGRTSPPTTNSNSFNSTNNSNTTPGRSSTRTPTKRRPGLIEP